MSISMQQIDSCIETTINRLSSEAGTMVSKAAHEKRESVSR